MDVGVFVGEGGGEKVGGRTGEVEEGRRREGIGEGDKEGIISSILGKT